MANPTTNFGWVMPTSTSLVTNLPADFNTFGQGVDTSLAQLKGGTTGQILSKTSATDMAFTWITNDVGDITAVTAGTGISGGGTSGAVTITNSMATTITTAGDLIKGTGSGTFDRLGIGSTGQVLTVSGGAPVWAAPAGGGKVLQVIMGTTSSRATNSTTTYADTNLTATITPSSASSKVLVIMSQCGVNRTNGNSGNALLLQLQRGGSSIAQISNEGMATDTAIRNGDFTFNISYLDSPATTSATTYKTQFKNRVAAATISVQEASELSTIILMEIGA